MALNKEFMHWHIPYGVVYFRKIKYYSTSNRYPQGSFNEYQMTITTKDVLCHHLGLYMLWQKNAPLMKPDTVFEVRQMKLDLTICPWTKRVLCLKYCAGSSFFISSNVIYYKAQIASRFLFRICMYKSFSNCLNEQPENALDFVI